MPETRSDSSTLTAHATHSPSEKILRAVVLGTLAVLGFYLTILKGILNLGIKAIRKT